MWKYFNQEMLKPLTAVMYNFPSGDEEKAKEQVERACRILAHMQGYVQAMERYEEAKNGKAKNAASAAD